MRTVLVPGVLALLPEYAGLTDPVAELRAACLEAVAWLGQDVTIVADPQGERVARALLLAAGVSTRSGPRGAFAAQPTVVVGNGSACRTEKAPGHLDERAIAFDNDLRDALIHNPFRLRDLDQCLARELWADVGSLVWLGKEMDLEPASVRVDYDDAPFGVQYWVMRWGS